MVDRDTALAAFLRAFGEARYFEAHEILEEFWVTYQGPDRDFYKGLIQSAVALHHAAHANPEGARGVATRARRHLAPYAAGHAGVDVEDVLDRLAQAVP
ncbi:MAG TPA: DUF309 domain-containing protein [Candidatus Sulfotelmatobacter sp.]|jgi:predicted metal-dependent hydrolase|nr:DUF309 domain-containing protein [Candidatus Sulfotelmatobacter sp.]